VRRQIGNAVPSPGARAVALELMKLFKGEYSKAQAHELRALSDDALKYVIIDQEVAQLPFAAAASNLQEHVME
jgi:hypothetical protein